MKSVTDQMQDILEQVGYAANEAIEESSKKAAKKASAKLRAVSPVKVHGKKKGSYAKGWSFKKDGNGYIVHNKAYPGLTHLLEHGHVSKNQYGQYDRVPAHPHIKSVENEEVQAYVDDLIDTFNKKV